jgi:hypothetical protein
MLSRIGFLLVAFCMLSVFGGIVVVFIIIAIRRWSSMSQLQGLLEDRPPRPPIRPRIAADGFWLHSPGIRTGSNVRYRYRAGGTTRTGEVAYEPGPEGVFIYTGEQPDDIEILDIRPPQDRGGASGDFDMDSDTGPDIDDLLRSEPSPGAPLIDALPADDVPPPSESPSGWSASEPPAY